MTHILRDRGIPVSNDNISNLYCETTLTLADTETWISPLGGARPNFPSNDGELIRLVSDNAADDFKVINVIGLGVDFKIQEEVVFLNGLTPVKTTKLFTRINSLAVGLVPGDSPDAVGVVGTVLAQNEAGDTNYRCLVPQSQYSPDGVASIPVDKRAEFENLYFAITRDTNQQAIAYCSLYLRFLGSTPFFNPFKFSASTRGSSISTYDNPAPQSFEGPIDIYITAIGSAANIDVVARFITLELQK